MFIATGHMAIVLVQPTEATDISNFVDNTEDSNALKTAMFTNPLYRKHAEVVFPWLYYRGAF